MQPHRHDKARRTRTAFATLSLWVGATLAMGVGDASGQVIRGTITDQETGSPVALAHVLLLWPSGETVAGTLTDGAGRFSHRVEREGAYSLRVDRIGYRSETRSISVTGTSLEVHLQVASLPIVLPELIVEGEQRCGISREQGSLVVDLWDEARKALAITVATEASPPYFVRVREYERTLDLATEQVLDERSQVRIDVTEAPYLAEPAEALARSGYVRAEADGFRYFGLSAETILSRPFEDTHCFSARPPGREQDQNEIGLAFEPLRTHQTPDVAGVLWLDRSTHALKRVEYHFTQHLYPVSLPGEAFGGRTDFAQQPDGRWLVTSWWLRMPQAERVIVSDELPAGVRLSQRTAIDPGDPWSLRRMGLSIREVGAEVLAVDPVIAARGTATLRGEVYDSITGRFSAEASVYLDGTDRQAHVDGGGRFVLSGLLPGDQTVTVHTSTLDALGATPLTLAVTLRSRDTTTVRLATPSAETLLGSRCAREQGMVIGFVRGQEDGRALEGVRVVAQWMDQWQRRTGGGMTEFQGTRRERGAVTDQAGAYALCDIPVGTKVRVLVSQVGGHEIAGKDATIPATGIVRVDATIPNRR